MTAKAGNLPARVFVMFVLGFFALTGSQAYAAPPEGCNVDVQKAQEAKAEVKVAADVNVTEEHIEKPDTTMATTCFNNLSGINASGAAGGGGTIFSGDFINASPSGNPGGLRADIQDALQTFYTAFVDAMGADSGLVDYTQTTLTNSTTCNETGDLWTEVKQGGVEQGVPLATITDLINGTIPGGAKQDYTANWGTEQGTDNNFSNFQTTLNAELANVVPTLPVFNQVADFCTNLQAANVTASCP